MADEGASDIISNDLVETVTIPLSKYAQKLDMHVRKRYLQKISVIGVDPLLIPEEKFEGENLPPVEAVDVFSFLVLETSHYSKEQFKAFKSLEAYNQMVSGFITSVLGCLIGDKFVVIGKVRHSQRMNDAAVPIWLLTQKDGTILCAHCIGCKAGLGECCSHIASVLFYVEVWNRVNDKLSCTQVKCTWLLPTAVKEISYSPVREINFSSAKKMKTLLNQAISDVTMDGPGIDLTKDTGAGTAKSNEIPSPTEHELAEFYAALNKCEIKAAALSLISGYADQFVLKTRDFATVMDLFNKDFLSLSYDKLLLECRKVVLHIDEEHVTLIEKDTREQSKGPGFYHHRAGRIGSSASHSASHSNPAQPSQSLIKSICYPEIFKFSSAATDFGCKHEKLAISAFEAVMKAHHKNYRIKECGLFVSMEHPFIHATPDFMSSCDCCGEGCGEVKCPYCLEGSTDFQLYMANPVCCLVADEGVFRLRRGHTYYYQVQQQIKITGTQFCDFVVCRFDHNNIEFISERITFDSQHWEKTFPKLDKFWYTCILPEVLGRWYTRKENLLTPRPSCPEGSVCFCQKVMEEETVKCRNENCPIRDYHPSCLKIDSFPKSWLCPHCQKLPEFKRGSKTNQDDVAKLAKSQVRICICQKSFTKGEKLLKCCNDNCANGMVFHLSCIGYKRRPKSYKTTWFCDVCKTAKTNQDITPSGKQKESPESEHNDSEDDLTITHTTVGVSRRRAALATLTDEHFEIIVGNRWIDCDIVHQSQVLLQMIDPLMQGLQRPTLGPARNFVTVQSPFVQIIHTGSSHWVCVGSTYEQGGFLELYDSMYHGDINEEVVAQVKNLVGEENYLGLSPVPVCQQTNSDDCGIYAIAFATCVVHKVNPQDVVFAPNAMRKHLYDCLVLGEISLFPLQSKA